MALFLAIVLGIFFTQGHEFSFMIKYLIMLMLFFSFLEIQLPKTISTYIHSIIIFIAMCIIGFAAYFIARPFLGDNIATIAFLIGFTPTATAAPVVIKMLKKDISYVVTAVIATNVLVALLLPFILPGLLNIHEDIDALTILISTLSVVLLPLLIAQITSMHFVKLAKTLKRLEILSFYIWVVVVYIAISSASNYIFYETSEPSTTVVTIALIAIVICTLNFMVGSIIGGDHFKKEASQSLGQKNTMFMTWIALEYLNPIAALGPVFYLIYQNVYNSYLLAMKTRGSNY